MGKHGPCCHCGINYTPLWRNGPPEKPILCNACGSRWRTKGSLVNYIPLHSRSAETAESSEYKVGPARKVVVLPTRQSSRKRKEPSHDSETEIFDSDQHYDGGIEDDASNGSSSASGISYSEGCMQYGVSFGIENSEAAHTSIQDWSIPSRKRTSMYRKRLSSVAKLTKGLQYILHEQESSNLSDFSEDILLSCKSPMNAAEIGLGSVFIRNPQSMTREEESEASSLLVDGRAFHAYDTVNRIESGGGHSMQLRKNGNLPSASDREKGDLRWDHQDNGPSNGFLENFPNHKLLQSCYSPLTFVELKDIVNYESFVGILTVQEQNQLMKYVASVDSANFPESLVSMFASFQFDEALTNFQKLLHEGVFDMHISGSNPQIKQTLQKYILTDLAGYKWIEVYLQSENRYSCRKLASLPKEGKNNGLVQGSATNPSFKSNKCSAKKLSNGQNHKISAGKSTMGSDMESKTEVGIGTAYSYPTACSLFDAKGSSVSGGLDKDLLVDVPISVSFQQAEFLQTPDRKSSGYKGSVNSDKLENSYNEEELASNFWASEDSLECSGLLWSPSNFLSCQSPFSGSVLPLDNKFP